MNRTITVSDIEPATLSLRSPSGIDLALYILMKRQNGEGLDQTMAQPVLQLEPRSGGNGVTYTGAYDVAGGVKFTVPGSDLKDANGYRLSIWGVLDGIYQLMARGVALLTPAAPPEATKEVSSGWARGIFNLNIVRYDSWTWQFTLWGDTAKTVPSDLTDALVTAQIRSAPGGPVLADLGIEVKDAVGGVVWMSITSGQSGILPSSAVWDMQIAYTSGDIKTPVGGRVIVTEDVTR